MIVGKTKYIEKIRRHPFYRALRADKLCLAALSATLLEYLKNSAEKTVKKKIVNSKEQQDMGNSFASYCYCELSCFAVTELNSIMERKT